MAGGTMLHAALSAAVLTALATQLAGRCRTYTSDLRVRVLATGLASYPDVTVVCGKAEVDPESKETVVNPTAVVEVLSPATIDYDLGEKFEHYRRIPSLQAVVYVWQDRRQLEIRGRSDGEVWHTETFSASATALLEALGCTLDVDALYTSAGA